MKMVLPEVDDEKEEEYEKPLLKRTKDVNKAALTFL